MQHQPGPPPAPPWPPDPPGGPWYAPPPPGPPPGFAFAGEGGLGQLAAAMVYNANMTNAAVQQMAHTQFQQGAALHTVVGNLAQTLQQDANRRGQNQGFRALKPKREIAIVTCETAKIYMLEEVQFGIDLGELGVNRYSEAGFRQLRACCTNRAKDTIELFLAHGPGLQVLQLLENAATNPATTQAQRDEVGAYLVTQLMQQLEASVHLTPERRVKIALEIDAEAVMHGDTAAEVESFLTKWRRARYVLHVAGMVADPFAAINDLRNNGTPENLIAPVAAALTVNARREINELLEKRLSPVLYEYIKQRPQHRLRK